MSPAARFGQLFVVTTMALAVVGILGALWLATEYLATRAFRRAHAWWTAR